jgi:hypothetical protein
MAVDGMTDMDKPSLPAFDQPVDQVGITTDRKHACISHACPPTTLRKFSNELDRAANSAFNITRRAWVPIIEIFNDEL